jgi:hypothetical protein
MAYINNKKVLQVVINNGGGASSTLLTTTTDATLVSGTTYELALTYLTETPKVNDFIAYVDSGAITTLYKVTAVDSTNATLTKIGDIGGGGGTTLYQHNIYGFYTTATKLTITIWNEQSTAMNAAAIMQWLKDKGFRNDNAQNVYYHECLLVQNGTPTANRITYNSDTQLGYVLFTGTGSGLTLSDLTLKDTVIPL